MTGKKNDSKKGWRIEDGERERKTVLEDTEGEHDRMIRRELGNTEGEDDG